MKAWGGGLGWARRGQWWEEGDIYDTFNNKELKKQKKNLPQLKLSMYCFLQQVLNFKIGIFVFKN